MIEREFDDALDFCIVAGIKERWEVFIPVGRFAGDRDEYCFDIFSFEYWVCRIEPRKFSVPNVV